MQLTNFKEENIMAVKRATGKPASGRPGGAGSGPGKPAKKVGGANKPGKPRR